ncbi:hypothetical protein A3G98_00230 [Candidatus Nomurabacteria bacterium RIFCSPLOWO2_12_FULL_37_8]|uniref:Fibronectin type-III domain-containing protein n=1 Tax=Candidatus Nomurabacteria bacterium RIFCSPLOWO2_12_FULL_37_8 TaxID=1801793 RepID=A0A1F6Y577_9BACT|nr:MAG: hypothetical protein A3G98_00230 [Candidatus Nomurabacteria bacterium RIFCSPLOWO2_12_FULL_37_8]
MYASVNLTGTYKSTANATRVLRQYVHFKKPTATDFVVIYDDVALSAGNAIKAFMHFQNPTNTILDSINKTVVSTGSSRRVNSKVLSPAGNVIITTDNASGTYTGGAGKTYRTTICPSTDSTTCSTQATSLESFTIHQPLANTTDALPSIGLVSTDANSAGIEIGGADPKVAVFAKSGVDKNTVAFTTTHSSTAQYLVAGLVPGRYDIKKDNVDLLSNILVDFSDNSLYFESTKGAFQVFIVGAPLPPPVSIPEVVLPVISGIATSSVGTSTATITWNTDVNTDTQVEYGLTTGYGSSSNLKDTSIKVTSHSVVLSSLSPNTTYNFRVKSRDAANNIANSSNQIFITLPVGSTTISTKFRAGDRVQTTSNLNVRSTASPTGTLLGTQSIGNLGTILGGPTNNGGFNWWNVNYDSGVDGWSVEDYLQVNGTSITPPSSDTTVPVISSINTSIDTSTVTITWSTNELSDTQVEYGLTSSYGSVSVLTDSTTKVNSHTIILNNLIPATTYNFRVKSKDAAGNLASSSNQTFTTQAPPSSPLAAVISNIKVSSITNTSVNISWTTSKIASSQVLYGLIDSVNFKTTEVNIALGATNHSVNLTGLIPCSKYRFRVRSSITNLESLGAVGTFATSGCTANAPILDESTKEISRTLGGELSLVSGLNNMKITIPSNSITPSSSFFQLQSLSRNEFITSITAPGSKRYSLAPVYHIAAFNSPTSTISTFAQPITITFTYTDSDIEGINESTLKLYRYDGSSWYELSGCSVNVSTNNITCTSSGFSEIVLIGDASTTTASGSSSSGTPTSGGSSAGGSSYSSDSSSTSGGGTSSTGSSQSSQSSGGQVKLTMSLYRGLKGADIITLQNFLISQSLLTPNSTTGYFGPLTEAAVKAFQVKYGIVTSGTPSTTGYGSIGPITRAKINELLGVKTTSTVSTPVSTTGGKLAKPLYRGLRGTDVTTLQNVLIKEGLLSSDSNTGYFGPLTEAAVKAFQVKYGIVTSGTPSTTGYGSIGPRTRAKINEMVGNL